MSSNSGQSKGTYRMKNYEINYKHPIGYGLIATIFEANDIKTEPPKPVVIKSYSLSRLKKRTITNDIPLIDKFNSECENLKEINGIPHCIQLNEIIEDETNGAVYLVLEPLASFGSLQSSVDKSFLSPAQIKLCFYQIAEALDQIHAKNIVHRDINPENILCLTKESFLITDFNSSRKLISSHELLDDTEGCLPYMSPEEVSGDKFDPKIADVWKYGVTFFKIIFGQLPFNLDYVFKNTIGTITVLTLLDAFEVNSLSMDLPQKIPVDPPTIQLIQKILNKDPLLRPTFHDIINDPCFSECKK